MPWLHLIALLAVSCAAVFGELGANLALRQAVEASDDVWASLSPVSLTDGDPSTFCHPLAASGTREFYFEVDLGQTYQLEEIRIRNRNDGCCPERLSRYRVEVYADAAGETGPLQWAAEIRANGTHSGVGGVDVIRRAANPAANFAGRFVRVVNNSGLPYSPQLAEIEVYGRPPPVIKRFEAERDTLAAGESTTLDWEISNATGARIDPGGAPASLNGTLVVQPRETTTYTLTATNESGAATASVMVGVDVELLPPRITEFLAENESGLKDDDRDESDWIELHNPNPFHLEIGGFFLTDQASRPTKWRIPARRIPPGGRVVIFASGKDRAEAIGELHTNFRLDTDGEYLALVDARGMVVQRFPADYPTAGQFPAQSGDVSYGVGANGIIGFMRPPTPAATNGVAFEGAVGDTKFSRDRGYYSTNFLVTISCETPGAIIRYTTDRSEPSLVRGTTYSGPIEISRTTVLRAAAFRAGWSPSNVDTHTYIFLSNVVSASVMRTNITRNPAYSEKLVQGLREIPAIALNTPATINSTAEVAASVEWITGDHEENAQENCGVRHFGGAFTTFAKKNFRLYFRAEYGAPKFEARLFEDFGGRITPVDSFDQLELRGGSHDMEQRGFYMSNIFTDDALLDLKQLNPHGRFVHLYHNGTYWGVFHLRERWNDAMHESYLGGARTNYESINGNWNVGGWAEPGTPYDGDGSAWAKAKTLRNNYQAVKPLLDVEQYIDFMLVWMFGGAEDEYRAVGPTTAGSGFKFYVNDADGWFCVPRYCEATDRTARGSPGRAFGDGPGSFFSTLFAQGHPDYRVLLADRIHNAWFHQGALTPAKNIERLRARTGEIENAFIAEAARWNYLTITEWQNRRDYVLTNWFNRRTAEVLSQFRRAGFYPSLAAPVFGQHGGMIAPGSELRFNAPPRGQVLFTIDGTDPRLPGGSVSPSARSGAFTITNNVFVKARVRDGTQWSALNEAFFQAAEHAIAAGDLAISEIHFVPEVLGTEFVELMNISGQAIDLDGVELSGGVRFAFGTGSQTRLAPRQRLLLVRDLLRFQQWYGLDVTVNGVYAGRLAPEGEEFELRKGTSLLGVVSFARTEPWPAIASGHTLVLRNPEFGLANPAAWRMSARPGGSPGFHDAKTFSGDPAADADQDGVLALVEYAFGSSDHDAGSGRGLMRVELDPAGILLVSFPREPGTDDVTIYCESSHDLITWNSAAFLRSEITPEGQARESWTAAAAGRATFVRVNVRQQ